MLLCVRNVPLCARKVLLGVRKVLGRSSMCQKVVTKVPEGVRKVFLGVKNFARKYKLLSHQDSYRGV